MEHVSQNPGFLVVPGAATDNRLFRRGNLDVVNMVSIPNRLKNRVGKPQNHDVGNGFFAEVMVDSINLRFVKPLMNKRIERNRRRSVRSKRLFKNNSPPGRCVRLLCHASAPELFDDGLIRLRSHRQIEHSSGRVRSRTGKWTSFYLRTSRIRRYPLPIRRRPCRSSTFQLTQKRVQTGERLGQVDVAGEILNQLRKQSPFRLVKPVF